MENQEYLVYKIAISLIPGIGAVTARNLIAYVGSVEGVFQEKEKNLMKIPGIGEVNAQKVVRQNVLERAKREVDFILKNRIKTYFYLDENYPTRLKNCSDAPIILFYKGNANLNERRIISVVGTRNATNYGKELCDELIRNFSERSYPILVVSGLAYGIDIHAHKACLKYNIPTVGVFAHGLDNIYPALHAPIATKMLEKGGVLSDFISQSKIDRQNFLRRNRIIAGLADATIVVESAEKGGALVTADIANSYNRDVFAFPGRSNDPFSKGCNKLIKLNEAILIENQFDIEKAMNWDVKTSPTKVFQTSLFVELTPEEQKLVDLLKGGDRFVDEITIETQMPMSRVSALLLGLEFKGLIISLPGKMYRLK
ncbi:MAG: DNA-processing protein DprA [Bacteroidota bacterium]|nr:DNA-processing protein DprA [Bacteroidota bacterium]MDP3433625.1 DNA-processing protein DprA [Bacteroidota bacterium]